MQENVGERGCQPTACHEEPRRVMSTLTEPDQDKGRSPEYVEARKRLEKQRKFRSDVLAYTVINALLIVVWAVTGFGYFWPGWVLGGWGGSPGSSRP